MNAIAARFVMPKACMILTIEARPNNKLRLTIELEQMDQDPVEIRVDVGSRDVSTLLTGLVEFSKLAAIRFGGTPCGEHVH